jgi:hypothetical protein
MKKWLIAIAVFFGLCVWLYFSGVIGAVIYRKWIMEFGMCPVWYGRCYVAAMKISWPVGAALYVIIVSGLLVFTSHRQISEVRDVYMEEGQYENLNIGESSDYNSSESLIEAINDT